MRFPFNLHKGGTLAKVDGVDPKAFHSKVLARLPQVNTITAFVVIDSPKNERG
jgi:hypothetical protein